MSFRQSELFQKKVNYEESLPFYQTFPNLKNSHKKQKAPNFFGALCF